MSDNEEDDYFSNSGSEDDDDETQVSESDGEVVVIDAVDPDVEEEDEEEEDEVEEDEVEYQDPGEESDVESVASNVILPIKSLVGIATKQTTDDDESDDDENDDDTYLQRFDTEMNETYISTFHPECSINNYDEIAILSNVIRDANNNIIDPFHKTTSILTKYEKARIIGQRAKQINSGATPFIRVPDNIIDGSIIAEMELNQKRVPFIIRRPLPNGTCEYWNLRDLEILS
jgi:DNA-directed RNA polymerase I, II, and III subunit RPABC2